MKRSLALQAAGALVLAAAGRASAAEEPYDLPVLLSLTGPIAFLGKSCADTLKALEAYVNKTGGIRGRPLKLTISDIQSNPTVAVQVANVALQKHPAIILGPEYSAAVSAITPLLKDETVMYAFSSSAPTPSGGYVFTSGITGFNLQLTAVRYLRGRGIKRVGILSSTDLAGADLLQRLEEALRVPENGSMSIVASERFAGNDFNVNSQLANVKAAGAEVLFANTAGTPLATVLRGYNDAGLTIPVMTNAANASRVQMDQYASFLPRELLFCGPLRFMAHDVSRPGPVKDAQKAFYDAMKAAGIPKPDFGNNIAWDGALAVVHTLRALGPNAGGPAVHNYLMNLHGLAATNGMMDFRDGQMRGVNLVSAMVVKWDAAKGDWLPVSEPGTGQPLKRMS